MSASNESPYLDDDPDLRAVTGRPQQRIVSGHTPPQPDDDDWAGVGESADDAGAGTASAHGAAQTPARRLRVTMASDITMRRIRWLWDLRVVLGGLTLLAGREGIGKSTIAVWLAAAITRGQLDGELKGEPRTVVYVNSEDARDYTIVPRLTAAGADLDRVVFVDAVMPGEYTGQEYTESIILPRDARLLAAVVREHNAALVILDAATSVIDGRLDGDKDRHMRQGLEAIGRDVGESTDAAVLGIVHFGKRESADTGKLILGSIAWSQVARSVLAVALDDKDGSLVITRSKGNLGAEPPSLSARVMNATVPTTEGDTHVGCVVMLGETDADARDLLDASAASADERSQLDEATEWLRAYLVEAGGSDASEDVLKAAKRDGIAEKTLQRSKRKAGVVSRKVAKSWKWVLNGGSAVTSEDGQDSQHVQDTRTCMRDGHVGHLEHLDSSGGLYVLPDPTACTRCRREPAIVGDPLGRCRSCAYPLGADA